MSARNLAVEVHTRGPENATQATRKRPHTQPAAAMPSGRRPQDGAAVPPRPRVERLSAVAEEAAKRLLLPALTFLIVILAWAVVQDRLAQDLPTPLESWARGVEILSEPFYDEGPNDKGIAWQLLYSLGRVMSGFGLAVAVGVPVGFLMGTSETARRAWHPLIQILKPVSPLAWLPLGLLLFKAVDPSAVFVIFITSIWPVILNTAAGVRAIPQDYMNVAAVLRLGRLEVMRKILIPAALPHIITGMRLSLGVAWMVIVAAEMLTGGIGIGFYIWDEWNNLDVAAIIVAIVLIGLIGVCLEAVMELVQNRLDYNRR